MFTLPSNRLWAPPAAGLLALALAACSSSQADPRLEAPLVRTATLEQGVTAERAFSGVVSARVQSSLGFRVSGKVIERLVDAGEIVKKGQPLMRMDRTDFAHANAASTSAVESARALAIQAAADEKRLRGLVSAGAISASAYDQAKAASDSAAARLKAAEAQANVASDELDYSVLKADADGTVVDTLAEPGQVVTAGQVVIHLAHAGPREALISLPETVRPALGSTAKAIIFGDAGETGSARLRLLSDAADPTTRTFEARFVLAGAAADVPLGSTVTVYLPDATAKGSQIPIAAIYDNGKGPGVWVVQDKASTVTWRAVTVAGLADETATIQGGLKPGERFVALGAHYLREGEVVKVGEATGGAP